LHVSNGGISRGARVPHRLFGGGELPAIEPRLAAI